MSLRNGLACTALELVAPRFRCNPCAGTAPQLRQLCCPNSDHAKFLSITQARESPQRACGSTLCGREKTRRRAFAAAVPRSGPRTAGFPNEILARAGRRTKCARSGPVAAGLTGAFGDEVFHGIFGGGTGPSGGQRAGAGARALRGGIGCRSSLCSGAAPGSRAVPRARAV